MSIRGHSVDDNSVAHVHDAVEIGCCFGVVSDHDDSLAEILIQLAKHLQDNFRVFRIQISRRLVGKQDFRLVDDRPRDGYALLLAAGKFGRLMVKPPGEAKHLRDDIETVRVKAVAMNELRDGDVALCRKGREQIEALEDEADLVAAQFGARCVTQGRQIIAVYQDLPTGRLRQPADDDRKSTRLNSSHLVISY